MLIRQVLRRLKPAPKNSIIQRLDRIPYGETSLDELGEGYFPEGWFVPDVDLIQEKYDFKTPTPAKKLVIILSTQRSGSTFLCESLGALGFGRPHEYFQSNHFMQILAQRWGFVQNGQIDWKIYTDKLREKRTAPNGILAVNAHGVHLPRMVRALPYFEDLEKLCIVISRGNVIEQAVSLVEARQTRRWSKHYPSTGQSFYDYPQTKLALAQIMEQKAKIEAFLNVIGARIIRVEYEDLIQDPAAIFEGITGLSRQEIEDLLNTNRASALSKQSSTTTRNETLKRFSEDYLSDKPASYYL